MTSLVILDIDGVIKPFTSARTLLEEPENSWFEGETESGKFYLICFNADRWRAFIERMRSAVGDDEITFMWGSAWGIDSNTILKVLDYDERWPYIELSREDVGLGTWKIRSIQPVIESLNPDRVVWVDDELEADAFELAEERGNMLAVKTERYAGLTDEQMDEIVDFLTKQN